VVRRVREEGLRCEEEAFGALSRRLGDSVPGGVASIRRLGIKWGFVGVRCKGEKTKKQGVGDYFVQISIMLCIRGSFPPV
jgi:hypothetical protein